MKKRTVLMSLVFAVAVAAPLVVSTLAFANGSAKGVLEPAGFPCDTAGRTGVKSGNVSVSRSGTHAHVSVNGALPAGDDFRILLVTPNPNCLQIGSSSPVFTSDSAGYFEAAASFNVPTRKGKFSVVVVDTTKGGNNVSQVLKVLP